MTFFKSPLGKPFNNLFSALLALALSLGLASANAADKIPVLASFSILGDLVAAVGADRVAVSVLVGPDQDAHVFEPRPGDVKKLQQTRLLVTNGLGFEPWAKKLVRAAGYQGQVLEASQGVKALRMPTDKGHHAPQHGHGHDHDQADPHAWQDPNNAIIYVRNIAAALARIDPASASVYQANSAAYIGQLQALDAEASARFGAVAAAKRKVITAHDAFGYLGARYGIRFLAPQGVSTEAEPSAKQVAQLIRQIQRENIKAVFGENLGQPQLLAQLSRDAGVQVGATLYVDALSKPEGPAGTYLQLMRHNIDQLAAGMQKN